MIAQAQAQTETPLQASVAVTFEVLAWEIELAGARCIFLDALVGELMPAISADQRARLTEGMHAIDLLSQHLTSLSAFARQMSEEIPAETSAPVAKALAQVTLGALGERMFTALGGEETDDDRSDPGDLDLF